MHDDTHTYLDCIVKASYFATVLALSVLFWATSTLNAHCQSTASIYYPSGSYEERRQIPETYKSLPRPEFASAVASVERAQPIKIGVLHSLSGTMAISELTLKDTVLIMVDNLNKNGGLLGKKVEAVVVDPASNWPLFAEKARELLTKDKVAVVFGCWTSVSRKSVLPVFEELNGLLFYPVQSEGEEASNNVFYTGAAPNQQAIPAVEYLMSDEGGAVKRWVLEGTDYVYPRTTNKILEAFLKSKGVKDEDIKINYTPFGYSDWQSEVGRDQKFWLGREKNGRGIDHQRRCERPILQGARKAGR